MPLRYPSTAIRPAVSAIINFNMASIPATSTAVITLTTTLKEARPDFMYLVTCPNLNAGLIIGEAFSDAVGTVKFKVANVTAAAIDPAALDFRVIGF